MVNSKEEGIYLHPEDYRKSCEIREIFNWRTYRQYWPFVEMWHLKSWDFLKTPGDTKSYGKKSYESYLWQEVKSDKQLVVGPPPRFVYHYIEYNQKIRKTKKVEKLSKCQIGEKTSSHDHMSGSDPYTPRTFIFHQGPHTGHYRNIYFLAGSQKWQPDSKTPSNHRSA